MSNETFIENGKKYLIRTVTMIYAGEVIKQNNNQLLLKNASWIADTGRWSENLITCEFEEVEMYPSEKNVIIFINACLDIVEIEKLPTKTK